MKTLRIPLLHDLEEQDLDTALELQGERFTVDNGNWPESYPYAPFCCGRIARTEDSLVVDWRVSGLDLRVRNLQDRGRIWEDSACEIFIQPREGGEYFNFEVNPAGRLVAARGVGREGRESLTDEQFASIVRIVSIEGLDAASEQGGTDRGGLWGWRVVLLIPFDVLGLDPESLPASVRGNIYKCGDLTGHPHFVSWAPVGTEKPDFHRPEFFGEFRLAE